MKKTAIPKSKAKTAYGLLSEVRKIILAEPLRYDQHNYITRATGNSRETFPRCGTVGCVAGWVATLAKPRTQFGWFDAGRIAGKVLGLTDDQRPELYAADAAEGRPQTIEHARSGAEHIRRFQQKYATQLKAKRV